MKTHAPQVDAASVAARVAQIPHLRIPRHPGHHSALMADSIPR